MRIRSPLLYPTELQGHGELNCINEAADAMAGSWIGHQMGDLGERFYWSQSLHHAKIKYPT